MESKENEAYRSELEAHKVEIEKLKAEINALRASQVAGDAATVTTVSSQRPVPLCGLLQLYVRLSANF